MTRPGAISWVGLLTLMVDGPDLPVRGVISSREGQDPSQHYFGLAQFAGEPEPVFAGFASAVDAEPGAEPPEEPHTQEEAVLTRVWSDGSRVRLEHPDGRPSLIVGEQRCWQFRGDDPIPVVSPTSAVHYLGNATQLLSRREAAAFAGDDFTRPTGSVEETTFLGRRAYTVELAPPRHKPFPLQLVVDSETGLLLQQRNDGFDSVDEWTEIVFGEQLDEALFRWDGPTRSGADERAARERERQADLAERVDWFSSNVAALPLRLELDVSVHVHVHEPDGSFEASLGESGLGSLAGRPSSEQDWQLGWSEVQHRWTQDGWDWALSIHDHQLTETGLARLKQALGNA